MNEVLCDDNKTRTLHGVPGSNYVYANGRRVYGRVIASADVTLFHASSSSKYRHLVSAPVLAEVH